MTFGQSVKSRRLSLGLDVKAAAMRANIAYGYWYEIERDEASPSIEKAAAIAASLDLPLVDLLPRPQGTAA